jgi:uncharacterized protein
MSVATRPHMGSPGPFGLLCFGVTTSMLMFLVTTWADSSFVAVIASYATFYGGAGQFIAGIFELLHGNTYGATVFMSYGCFWMAFFLQHVFAAQYGSKLTNVSKIGSCLFYGIWAEVSFGFFIVSLNKNGCLMTIFASLIITLCLLIGGVYDEQCDLAAGYFGLFCGQSAVYMAFAEIYKDAIGVELPGIQPIQLIPMQKVTNENIIPSRGLVEMTAGTYAVAGQNQNQEVVRNTRGVSFEPMNQSTSTKVDQQRRGSLTASQRLASGFEAMTVSQKARAGMFLSLQNNEVDHHEYESSQKLMSPDNYNGAGY